MPQSELLGSEPGIASDLFTSGFSRDPNPTYARLRAERPISPVTSPRFDSFFITRYGDADRSVEGIARQSGRPRCPTRG